MDVDAANCLRVDVTTLEVLDAFGSAGVPALLLKGPATCEWLYAGDRTARPYHDCDLLVPPPALARAGEELASLGFAPLPVGPRWRPGRPPHAVCWYRAADRAAVDLHATVHGAEWRDAAQVWCAATATAERIDLLGRSVEVPGEDFRALHLVLHLQPRDGPGSRSWQDLDRAVGVLDRATWRAAAALARRLQLDGDVGALLARHPSGTALARELGLPTRWPLHLRLRHDAGTSAAIALAELLEAPWPARPSLLRSLLAPSTADLRTRHPEVGPSRAAVAGARLAGLRRRTGSVARSLVAASRRPRDP